MPPAPTTTRTRRQFELSAGALALDFANTWGDRSRPETDQLRDYADLLDFFTQAGLIDGPAELALRRRAAANGRAAQAAFDVACALREALARLFSARAAGRSLPRAELGLLNQALREAGIHLQLEARGGSVAWAWRNGTGSLEAPLRPVARAAAELLTSPDLARVRLCDGEGCTWLFLDRSRNRSRRWCSMESCGNRAKVRRHHLRQRGARERPPGPR